MSFFLIRLLQNFTSFTLADEAQPKESIADFRTTDTPDAELEKRVFAAHLTMYLKVSRCSCKCTFADPPCAGRSVGKDGGIDDDGKVSCVHLCRHFFCEVDSLYTHNALQTLSLCSIPLFSSCEVDRTGGHGSLRASRHVIHWGTERCSQIGCLHSLPP